MNKDDEALEIVRDLLFEHIKTLASIENRLMKGNHVGKTEIQSARNDSEWLRNIRVAAAFIMGARRMLIKISDHFEDAIKKQDRMTFKALKEMCLKSNIECERFLSERYELRFKYHTDSKGKTVCEAGHYAREEKLVKV
jgi:Fe-S cluster assembly scaffold protein SufB